MYPQAPVKKKNTGLIVAAISTGAIVLVVLAIIIVRSFSSRPKDITGYYELTSISYRGLTISGSALADEVSGTDNYIEILDSNKMRITVLGETFNLTYDFDGKNIIIIGGNMNDVTIEVDGGVITMKISDYTYVFTKV